MGKFGALFEDSDDDTPVKAVPKPPVPMKDPSAEAPKVSVPKPPPPAPKPVPVPEEPKPEPPKAEEKEAAPPVPQPPPPAPIDSDSSDDEAPPPRQQQQQQQQPTPRQEAPPPVAAAEAPVPVPSALTNQVHEAFALSSAALVQQSDVLRSSMANVQADVQAGLRQTAASFEDRVIQSTASLEERVLHSSDELKTAFSTQLGDVVEQLKILAQPPPAPAPITTEACPPLNGFPEYTATEAAPSAAGNEEQSKFWEKERSRLLEDCEAMHLRESERDAQIALQHSSEQTLQLRKEKDELRNAYEELQAQLNGMETALQQQTAREGQETASFKKSFNDIMKQQAGEADDLRRSLAEEQGRTAELRQQLLTQTKLADERGLTNQELDLHVNALKVEKHELETRLALTTVQVNSAKSESQELRKLIDRMDSDRTVLCKRLEEVMKDKCEYMSGSVKKHNEHVTALQSKYEERELFLAKEMSQREAGMRDGMLKFAEHLQRLSEDYLGRQKATFHKLQIQTTEEHKKDLAAMRDDRKHSDERHAEELAALRREIEETRRAGDKKVDEAQRDASEKLTQAKQDKERALQAAHMEGKARMAEVEKQHRIRETNFEKKGAEDKEQLMTMFSRELTKISDEHRKAERDLERHHREREMELEKHVKFSRPAAAAVDRAPARDTTPASADAKDDIMEKWDKQRQTLRDRHEQAKKSLQ